MLQFSTGTSRVFVTLTQGIVTNATDVKPMLTVATYLDTITGIEVYQEVTGVQRERCYRCAWPQWCCTWCRT